MTVDRKLVEAEVEKNWQPLKLALWRVVTDAELNGNKYVNAYDLTDKLYRAALDAADARVAGAIEAERERIAAYLEVEANAKHYPHGKVVADELMDLAADIRSTP